MWGWLTLFFFAWEEHNNHVKPLNRGEVAQWGVQVVTISENLPFKLLSPIQLSASTRISWHGRNKVTYHRNVMSWNSFAPAGKNNSSESWFVQSVRQWLCTLIYRSSVWRCFRGTNDPFFFEELIKITNVSHLNFLHHLSILNNL